MSTRVSWKGLILFFGAGAVFLLLSACESIPKKEPEMVDLSTLSSPEHIAEVEDVERLLLYGQGYYDLGDYENALHSYNQALTIDPHNVGAKRGKNMSERAMEMANQGSFLDYQRY